MLTIFKENIKKYSTAYAAAEFLRDKYYQTARLIVFKKNILIKYKCNILLFGDKNYHIFFGYHDVTPFDKKDAAILANRVRYHTGAKQGNVMEVGYYNINDGKEFIKIDETTAWCWQMGCRLQWLPNSDNKIIYNKTILNKYQSVVYDIIQKREVNIYKQPLYSIAPNGSFGISLNFSRLQRLRPGYGYKDLPDDSQNDPMPSDDGLWLVNLNTGDAEMILSCADVAEYESTNFSEPTEHYFNHILWSPDSKHFSFLHLLRFNNGKRIGRAFLYNIDKKTIHPLEMSGYISHFSWKNNDEILMYSRNSQTGTGLNLYNITNRNVRRIAPDIIKTDGHPMFSPVNPDIVLLDSYPQKPFMERFLYIINLTENNRDDIGIFYSPPSLKGENKCDLHPRWNKLGNRVAVDSAHNGQRQIVVLELKKDIPEYT